MNKILTIKDRPNIDAGFVKELENEMVMQLGKAVIGYDDTPTLQPGSKREGSLVISPKRITTRSIFAGRNLLYVSVPGLGKTVLIMALGQIIHDANAVTRQFVSDLMPSDIIGSEVINEETGKYDFHYGPLIGSVVEVDGVFYSVVNIFGADEINRANPKMQSAMLGAMQEKRVMIGNRLIRMPKFFMVVGTRNPIENEGTYELPEAQLDRFGAEKTLSYLSTENEELLAANADLLLEDQHLLAGPATDVDTILAVRKWIHEQVYVAPEAYKYIVGLVRASRRECEQFQWLKNVSPDCAEAVQYGASPRAVQSFVSMAKASAAAKGREWVHPSDVQELSYDVLGHRIIRSMQARASQNGVSSVEIVDALLDAVPLNKDDSVYKKPGVRG